MRAFAKLTAALVLGLAAGPAVAQDWPHGLYLEFRGIFVLSDVGDVSLGSSMTGTFDEKADELEMQGALGGGIGYARNHSDTDQLFTATGASETIDNDNHNLACSLQTGVRVRLAEHRAANAGYRYIDLGKAESGRFSNGDQVTADHFAAHDFILGIVYML